MKMQSPAPEVSSCAPRTDFDEAGERELAGLCKALAHPIRVRILRILLVRSTCVCGELVGMLSMAQSTVFEHLKILKGAGLVQGEVDGPRVCYCVDLKKFDRLKAFIAAL